jgi:hypothetical protein
MNRRVWIAVIIALAGAIAGSAVGWGLFVRLPRWWAERQAPPPMAPLPAPPAEPARKIKARLFYVSEDGRGLIGEERDVPYGADVVAQARAILEAQIAPVDAPLVSAIPQGTTLRAVFVTGTAAYVDLSGAVAAARTRGSLDEQLTAYSVVGALTTNLPAVTAVQILVDGKEVDTLAGHLDLRQPLTAVPEWVR